MSSKVRRSTSSLQKRLSQSNQSLSCGESFEMMFQRFCVKLKSRSVPKIENVENEPAPGEIPLKYLRESFQEDSKSASQKASRAPAVLAVFNDLKTQEYINTIIFKGLFVDKGMLIALRKALEKFDTLTSLKLEFCNLDNTHLRTVKTILIKNRTIIDLSVNGNPNRFQNFYILLKGTKLQQLSLRCCQINDRGLSLISRQLATFYDQYLISLNLSSNCISDDGVCHLADALRVNRQLLFLNLADNWLTDTGCISLIHILCRFPLSQDEIFIRRQKIFQYLQKVEEEKTKFALESCILESDACSKTSKESKTKRPSSSMRKSSRSPSITSQTKRNSNAASIEQAFKIEVEMEDHPFVKDSYAENMNIYCKGNFRLTYLNLAYNKIQEQGLFEVISILQYQHGNTNEGLVHISLEGNHIEETDIDEFNIMQDMILRRNSSGSRRGSKRRKSASSKVSLIN